MIFPPLVSLDEESHVYTDTSGREYISNSKFCSSFLDDFKDTNAYKMASEDKKSEWKAIAKKATDAGTEGHKAVEDYMKFGILNEKYQKECDYTANYMKQYYRYFNEEIFYDEKNLLATTADLVGQRTKGSSPIYDVGDIKFNAKKFSYDSSYQDKKTGKRRQGNKFYHAPLNTLEYSYYTKTCIQIGIAMYLLEQKGHRVGKGFIILCDWENRDWQPITLPVPYMKHEVEAMYKFYFQMEKAF